LSNLTRSKSHIPSESDLSRVAYETPSKPKKDVPAKKKNLDFRSRFLELEASQSSDASSDESEQHETPISNFFASQEDWRPTPGDYRALDAQVEAEKDEQDFSLLARRLKKTAHKTTAEKKNTAQQCTPQSPHVKDVDGDPEEDYKSKKGKVRWLREGRNLARDSVVYGKVDESYSPDVTSKTEILKSVKFRPSFCSPFEEVSKASSFSAASNNKGFSFLKRHNTTDSILGTSSRSNTAKFNPLMANTKSAIDVRPKIFQALTVIKKKQ
jgi:hypothetical protein